MYMLEGKSAIISEFGSVWFDCGYFQGKEGCETRLGFIAKQWIQKCENMMKQQTKIWKQLLSSFIKIPNRSKQDTQLIKSCTSINKSLKVYRKSLLLMVYGTLIMDIY